MKAFIRKIRTVKKREIIKNAIGTCTTAWALRHGSISHKIESSPFFGNFNQSNQHMERSNPYHQTRYVDEDSQSSTENQSFEKIRRVKLGFDRELRMADYNRDSSTQKSKVTYSQDEIEALGLVGEVNKEVTSVVGLPMPRSSHPALAVHEKDWNRFVQESNLAVEQQPKIVMIKVSSDLTNQKWIQEFICSIRAGSTQDLDEGLIRSILGKVAEDKWDIPSINKLLKSIANATLSVASNEKLLKILNELQKPIQPSVPQGAESAEVATIPDNLQDYQQKSKTSSSIFAEAWVPQLPSHRSADSTRCYDQSQNQQNTRTLSVYDGSQADITESSVDHLLSKHGHNFSVKDQLPPNANQKPTKHQQIRTRVNNQNREKLINEAQTILNDKQFSEPFSDITIRGVKGRGYVYANPNYPGIAENDAIVGLFIGIHEEGPFQGQIKKMQPVTEGQLEILLEQRCID